MGGTGAGGCWAECGMAMRISVEVSSEERGGLMTKAQML